jgi:DNA-binding Xre family transcriptional regulator
LKKKDSTNIGSTSASKLAKNENIQIEIRGKISIALRCNISDIMEMTTA